jgi:hypothetical protein
MSLTPMPLAPVIPLADPNADTGPFDSDALSGRCGGRNGSGQDGSGSNGQQGCAHIPLLVLPRPIRPIMPDQRQSVGLVPEEGAFPAAPAVMVNAGSAGDGSAPSTANKKLPAQAKHAAL